MSKLSFFTPITYQTSPKSTALFLLEKVDNYFYLGGKKAQVIQGRTKTGQEKVILSETRSSVLARVGRFLSYFTIIIPLIMLIAKTALRSQHSFKLIDPKQKLEKGINISEVTAAKIQQLIPKIISREDDEAIKWLAKGNNLVFRIKETSNVVYKMARPGISVFRGGKWLNSKAISNERFDNMIEAKKVCLANDLGLLIIPHGRKFDVEVSGVAYTLIAEESLDFNPNESAQEELYHTYSRELNETARQLAIFVAKTGFNDVTWRNIPILNEIPEFHGPRRVALIDLEHMNSAINGFLGYFNKNGFLGDFNGSRGLVHCVSEEQIDIVIAEARKQGVAISTVQAKEAKARRLKEFEDDKRLRTLYTDKGVVTGKEPIQVDLASLGLDLTEESDLKWEKQTVTLREVAEDVIAEMNRLIQNSSDQASTKGKRYFVLNTSKDPFSIYSTLGLPSAKVFITEEEEKQLWLRRIVQALVDKGHIFKLDQVNGHGYFIQA
ncbi:MULTISPECIES: DUF648 domain-containing protein [unclassified Neochlamydia]|uniref:DUF648 domain-containing protein n=1 Tax=unclassified Neochlamydia TaxID=2643326 RepID=UPI00140DDC92|nr:MULTISPECIES: DUF648 domain-containing protein [unclassified Neochlamydia]MBS4166975.1 Uncharacterized protein [Neochlamydia sp. AcF65]MBS4170392.1 Uncharacterized protein [Neochlamydia sp. AcF95]NGY95393.1 hypothetical protein [Neochlamydia sp. AcF84]